MDTQNGPTLGAILIERNLQRMQQLDKTRQTSDSVSEFDQLLAIATILRELGFKPTRSVRDLHFMNSEGQSSDYQLMGLQIDDTLIGVYGERTWEDIEKSTWDSVYLFHNDLVSRSDPHDFPMEEDEQELARMSHFQPSLYRWMEEQTAELMAHSIAERTLPTRHTTRSSRL